ncbi:hypothetical protein FNT36_15080 [Hymenobacter setariae]|uniref:Uncharacterized protein n=1 Tax=Hymenobacter setariae TaxID=2594794 RepID=A0A558BR77_9BACT|nr:hypothetical protein [Hymenobacter setariae]TVT38993.1 hypothetical protein FNT36_15080 [Hymenobacter setariae]
MTVCLAVSLASCNGTTDTNANTSNNTSINTKSDTSMVGAVQTPQLSDSTTRSTEHLNKSLKASQKLVSLTATFHTTDNDKDWTTQIGSTVRLNGHVVGEIFCCSADRKDDHYDDNTDSPPIYLNISEHPTKDELNGSIYEITAMEVKGGTDEWHFDARLNAKFDDGSQRNWTFLKQSLHSKSGSREGIKFDLYKNHD